MTFSQSLLKGNRVGKCYIVPKAASGSCDMYVKSAIVGSDGDRGWPKTVQSRGSGCVRAPSLPRGVTACFYRSSSYDLPKHIVDSFCTDDGNANAVSMLKHAVGNDACELTPTVAKVPCVTDNSDKLSDPIEADDDVEPNEGPQCPVPSSPIELPTTITLDRIRRCRNKWFCNSVVTKAEYHIFGAKKMSKKHQKKVYISQVNVPQKEKTKNIVFAVAGQQFDRPLKKEGYSSGVTGQYQSYKKGFKKKVGSLQKGIDSNSLVSRIMRSGYFSLDDTFVGLVFDARFNYEFSKKKKNRNENGYYHYLLQRLGNDVGTIYLAGHSRGGCLVMRLASRLNAQFPKARIIVHNFDGVCTKPGFFASSEFGVSKSPTRANPLKNGWFVYTTDMNERFSNRKCLSILSVLSGEQPVEVKLANGILKQFRAFGHRGFATSSQLVENLEDEQGRVWYQELMNPFKHDQVDNTYHPYAASHLGNAMQSISCDCDAHN